MPTSFPTQPQRHQTPGARQRERAILCVQATFRAYRYRKAFKRLQAAALILQRNIRGLQARQQAEKEREKHEREQKFKSIMQRHKERIKALERRKMDLIQMPKEQVEQWEEDQHKAACKIQAWWRGHTARIKYCSSPDRWRREMAARRLQSAVRTSRQRKQAKDTPAVSASTASIAASVSSLPSYHRYRPSSARSPTNPTRASSISLLSDSEVLHASVDCTTATANSQELGQLTRKSAVTNNSLADSGASRLLEGSTLMPKGRQKELHDEVERKIKMSRYSQQGPAPSWEEATQKLDQGLSAYERDFGGRARLTKQVQQQLLDMEKLYTTLQQLQSVSDLPSNTKPHHYSLPPSNSIRMTKAREAHALGLAEARVGSQWWKQIKLLNKAEAQQAAAEEEREHWDMLTERCKRSWKILEEEQVLVPGVESYDLKC